jgi:hypothetical protein
MTVPAAAGPEASAARCRITGWFAAETHPINLAIARVIVFWLLFQRMRQVDPGDYLRIPAELWVPLPGWETFVRLGGFAPEPLALAQPLGAALCLFALVGFRTRLAAGLAVLLSIYVLALPESFGKLNHKAHHLIWFAALLAAGPSGDALSVDRWLARRRGEPALRPSSAYAQPLRFMWLSLGIAYFFAGLAKLASGPAWFAAPSLEYLLYEHWLAKGVPHALRVDRYPVLMRLLAVGTVAFELSFVFLVLSRRTRWLACLGGLAFHTGTRLVMRIGFLELMACYAVLVDWFGLWRHLASRLGARVGLPPGAAGSARRAGPAVVWIGTALLLANAACGALQIDTWPVSAYPRFGRVRTDPERTSLEVRVERSDGSSERIRPRIRQAGIGAILKLEDRRAQREKMAALVELVRSDGLALGPGDRLSFYAVTRSVLPEDRRRVLGEELLYEIEGPLPSGSP